MMTFGIKAIHYITALFILLSIGINQTYAQSDEVLAKSYYLKAEEAFNKDNNTKAIEYLDQTLEYLGDTNPKIEVLYIKTALKQKKYAKAEEHLTTYFEVADEGHSHYKQMLGYVVEVKEKVADKRAKEAEYKSKREQKVYNEVVEYFKRNEQICCNDYLEREALNIDWNTAKRALKSVVDKDMYGGSIKNDTLFQEATSVNMPLSEFKNMTFKVSEAEPNTFSITSSQLTINSIYGNQIDIVVEGRLNPTFVKNVKETLLNVVQQKRVIKYLREHPDKFPEKSQLLNEQSYLFAYGDRKEYDEDFPEGISTLKKETLIEKNSNLQNDNQPKKSESLKDRSSSFPGGETALVEYLSENIQYPEEAKASQVEGKVYVSFTVSEDGSLREIKAIRGPGFGLNKEAVRLFKNMPNWEPAIEQGKPMAIKMNMPLNFELPKESISEEEAALGFWRKTQNKLTKIKEENWSTLSQHGYTIDYPNNWSLDNNVDGNSGFILASPETSGNKIAFIRMESGNLDNNISLNSYAEIYVNGYLKKNYKDVNIIQNKTRERHGYSYRRIECSVKGKDNSGFDLLSNIIIHDKKVYVILFFRKSNELESLLPTAKKMFNSFSFL